MLKGDWDGQFAPFIIVAVGLLLIGAVAYTMAYSKGYQAADQRHAIEYAEYQAAQRDREKCLAKPTVEVAIECYEKAKKAPRDAERSEQDLDAQREMANWAEGMLWATAFFGTLSLIVGGFGIFYVSKTLAASQTANTLAIQHNEAQLRAYVIVKEITARYLYAQPSGQKYGVRIEFSVMNGGETPAVEIGHSIVITEQLYPGFPVYGFASGKRSIVAMTMLSHRADDLAPGAPMTVYEAELPLSGFNSIAATGKLNCNLECFLQYRPIVSVNPEAMNLRY